MVVVPVMVEIVADRHNNSLGASELLQQPGYRKIAGCRLRGFRIEERRY